MIKNINPILRQYVVVIAVNLGSLTVGMSLSWSSPVLAKLMNETQNVLARPVTEEEETWLVSIISPVAVISNCIVGYALDRIGRKYCIILATVPRILACLILTFATEVWMLMVGRAITGVLDVAILGLVPTYCSEISSKEVRGSLGIIIHVCLSLGTLIMFSVGPFASYFTVNVMFTCFSIIASVPLFFLPDSPYFLYSKGHKEEAKKALTFLRGSEDLADEEIRQYALTNSCKEAKNTWQLFKNKVFLKTLLLVILLSAGGQLVGLTVLSGYLQNILQSAHTKITPEIESVIVGCIQLIGSVCTAVFTDNFGRKPILIVTLIGSAIGLAGLGSFFKIEENELEVSGIMNYVPIICLMLLFFSHSAGIGGLYLVMMAELLDDQSRGTGVFINLIFTATVVFVLSKYFVLISATIGVAATFWVFATNCIVTCLFVIFFIPETKGKTFAEIQASLGAKNVSIDEEKPNVEKVPHLKPAMYKQQ